MLRSLLLVLVCAAAGLSTCTCKPIVVDGSPLTLPFVRKLNTTGLANILQHDQARARAIVSASKSRSTSGKRAQVFNVPITDEAVEYIANVGIGTPPTFYNLLVDTGSANIWVGAGKAYVPTASSESTGQSVVRFLGFLPATMYVMAEHLCNIVSQAVQYGSGSFAGKEFTDTVTIGSMVVHNVSIGSASTSVGFQGVDGVLG